MTVTPQVGAGEGGARPPAPLLDGAVLEGAASPWDWRQVARLLGPWVLAAAAAVALVYASSAFILLIIGTIVIYSISAIGLTWVMGRAGLVSIGNAAIMGVGAYITGIASTKAGIDAFPIPIILSALGGMVIGLLVGLPGLRVRGIYLAIATLALQYFVSFGGTEYQKQTNQPSGVPVNPISILGHTFFYGRGEAMILFAILGLVVLLVRNVLRQQPGRIWGAIRESDIAAAAIGVDIRRWKLAAFVGSSAVIAVAGSLFAYFIQVVSAASFSLTFAVTFIVIIILGGMGSIPGAVIGSIIVVALPHLLTSLSGLLPQTGAGAWLHTHVVYVNEGLYGFLLLAVLLYWPDGIAAAGRRMWDWMRRVVGDARRKHGLTGTREVAVPGSREVVSGVVPRPLAAQGGGPTAEPTPRPTGTLARIEDLVVTYRGGARAVDRVSIAVDEGAIVALLGRNGAGKTSTLRAISGFLPTEGVDLDGSVMVSGHELLGLPPARASRWAVLVPESEKVFRSLTVAEHLRVAGGRSGQDVQEQPFFTPLRKRMNSRAGVLSGGERQLLALAMAWQLRPRLLLVDEFSLGLAPVMVERVAEVIKQLRDDHHMSCVVVEQNVAAALEIADWVYLMEGGRIVEEGPPDRIASDVLQEQRILLGAAPARGGAP